MRDESEVDLLEHVIQVLDIMTVPYMIGGGVALTVWATPRMTHDIDIVVDLPVELITEFCNYFPVDRYFIDAAVMEHAFGQSDTPSLGMYSFIDMITGIKIDLFPLRVDDTAQQAALARRVKVEVVEGQWAFVYAPDDLLVQKLRWHAISQSERQLRDCFNLVLSDLKRTVSLIGWDYVDDWADQLGPMVQQTWTTVKGMAEQAQK